MTAIQDTFKKLLRVSIAPRLRDRGLQGSGQNYSLKSDSHWALIGFQKSMFSDSDRLTFTINLFVVSKELWEEARKERGHLPAKPSANVDWSVGWSKRIGHLLPEGKDYWWSLDGSTNLDSLSSEVIDAICDKAVPAMRDEIANAQV